MEQKQETRTNIADEIRLKIQEMGEKNEECLELLFEILFKTKKYDRTHPNHSPYKDGWHDLLEWVKMWSPELHENYCKKHEICRLCETKFEDLEERELQEAVDDGICDQCWLDPEGLVNLSEEDLKNL